MEEQAHTLPASWKLGLGNLRDPLEYVVPEDMRTCDISEKEGVITAVWTGHPECGDGFQVRAEFRKTSDSLTSGGFSFSCYAGKRFIEEIRFPVVKVPFSEDSKLYYAGYDLGIRITTLPPPGQDREETFKSIPFLAVVRKEAPGFYVDHLDPANRLKGYSCRITDGGNALLYSSVHPLGIGEAPCSEYRIPYEIRFGAFEGGWFEAAQIYKKWGTKQSWFTSRTTENPLRKLGLWVWNRGMINDVVPPVLQLQKDLPGIPVALDWYWWHHNPYDTDYPDFWPPREGEEKFRDAVALLKKNGIFTQTYVNGALWDLDAPSWKDGGEDSVIVRRDGSPYAIEFNKYNHHRLGFVCGEAPEFHDKLSALLARLRNAGLDGQYLDVIGIMTGEGCCNPRHSHLKNGGSYMAEGYRKMLLRLKKELPDFPLSTEFCNEAFMDLFDGAIVCGAISQEHFGGADCTPVPIFSAVYHGRNAMALFGNYAHPDGIPPWDPLWPAEDRWKDEEPWHKLYPDQFFIEVMRDVVWGLQPMVCNITGHIYTDPEFAEIYRFILDTAKFYYANRDFLFDGEMTSPSGFECAEKDVEFHARMIFTKKENCTVVRSRLPAVLHCCWRSPAGEEALFLGNFTVAEQSWAFRGKSGVVPPRSYEKIML